MKRLLGLSSSLVFVVGVSACGSNNDAGRSEFSVEAEPAGERCPAGGVRVSVDDDVHVVCHGEDGRDGTDGTNGADGRDGTDGQSPTIETEWVAADEEENPCQGPALKVTVVAAGSTQEVTEFVCQAPTPEPSIVARWVANRQSAIIAYAEKYCRCDSDLLLYYGGSFELCMEDNRDGYDPQRAPYELWCIDTAYGVYDVPPPESFEAFTECFIAYESARETCLNIFNATESCAEDDEEAFTACSSTAMEEFETCFGSPPNDYAPQFWAWMADFGEFTGYFGCSES